MKQNFWIFITLAVGQAGSSSASDVSIADRNHTNMRSANGRAHGNAQANVQADTIASEISRFPKQAGTNSGRIFTRVAENELGRLGIKNTAAFGQAWEDENGVIWGDIAKDEKGRALTLQRRDAIKHCQDIGAELPTTNDFVRIRRYMGAGSQTTAGYSPQVLPNLTYDQNGRTQSFYFWTASALQAGDQSLHSCFSGRSGVIVYVSSTDLADSVSVRCVLRRR